jgi:hypothetical protein
VSARSQASLEATLVERCAALARGEREGADDPVEWMLELDGRRLLLHPGLRRWLRHDPRHDEWYDTGHGPGAVLLLAEAGRLGAKRLPDRLAPPGQLAAIGDWCVYREGGRLVGPLPGQVARHAVDRGRITGDAEVWSAGATGWLSTGAFVALPPPDSPGPIVLAASARSLPECWLVADRGTRAGEAIPLRGRTRLGRGADCELVLDDARASREHAAIEPQGERWRIADLGSSNGTWLNGERIAGPRPLLDGDLVQIGGTRLRFRSKG